MKEGFDIKSLIQSCSLTTKSLDQGTMKEGFDISFSVVLNGSFIQLIFVFCNPITWSLCDKLRKIRFKNKEKKFLKKMIK